MLYYTTILKRVYSILFYCTSVVNYTSSLQNKLTNPAIAAKYSLEPL